MGRLSLLVLLTLLVVQLVIIWPRDVNEISTQAEKSKVGWQPLAEDIEQVMSSVHLVEARQGLREWELWADQAQSLRGQERWNLFEVKAVFFSAEGAQFTVTGARGVVELLTKNIRVEGEVLIRSANGYEYRTETVIYSSEDRRLNSPTQVKMLEPRNEFGQGLSLTGDSLDADLVTSQVFVQGNVHGVQGLERGREFDIRSHTAEFSGLKRMGVFVGNVVMDWDNMRVTGSRAEFEYDAPTQQVKRVLVGGGVRAWDDEKRVTSKTVRAYLSERRFVFEGQPRVVQDRDELQGERIVLLDGGTQVIVERARARVEKESLEKVN